MKETQGMITEEKRHCQLGHIGRNNAYFELVEGRRFTLDMMHFYELWRLSPEKKELFSWADIVQSEIGKNSALYHSQSPLVRMLVAKPFDVQRHVLAFIVDMSKEAGDTLALTASEWLLFSRACEYVTMGEGRLLSNGVDMHAEEVLNSIDGRQIQGLKSVVKESDVPFLQRKETKGRAVWSYAMRSV